MLDGVELAVVLGLQRGTRVLVQINSRVAYLYNLVQVGEGLVLVHLRHSQLLNEKLFHLFKLIDLYKIYD